jgi:hypothetical protein
MPRGSMWKIKRDDIFMRRGAGRDMGICPENRTQMNAEKRGEEKPSALVRASPRPVFTGRGAGRSRHGQLS